MHLLHIHGLYNLSYVLGLNNVYVDFRKKLNEWWKFTYYTFKYYITCSFNFI
jgi:hypothetical protein